MHLVATELDHREKSGDMVVVEGELTSAVAGEKRSTRQPVGEQGWLELTRERRAPHHSTRHQQRFHRTAHPTQPGLG